MCALTACSRSRRLPLYLTLDARALATVNGKARHALKRSCSPVSVFGRAPGVQSRYVDSRLLDDGATRLFYSLLRGSCFLLCGLSGFLCLGGCDLIDASMI
jgi:hypothetical protein